MEVKVKITLRAEEFLKALVRIGSFGNGIEEILEKIANERMFLLDDVRKDVIAGCILLGHNKKWIVANLPGNKATLGTAYERVKDDWYLYSKDPFPEKEE